MNGWFVLLCGILSAPLFSLGAPLPLNLQKLYNQRDFSALLILAPSNKQEFLVSQRTDLKSCRLLNEGLGDLRDVLTCMRFLARERAQGIKSKVSEELFREMDDLCVRLVSDSKMLSDILVFSFPWNQKLPEQNCQRKILDVASDHILDLLDSRPVQAWSLYKKTKRHLAPEKAWVRKLEKAFASESRISWSGI